VKTRSNLECSALCAQLNSLTNPAKLRTDYEHEQARREAKRVRAELQRRFVWARDYIETDSGAVYAVGGGS